MQSLTSAKPGRQDFHDPMAMMAVHQCTVDLCLVLLLCKRHPGHLLHLGQSPTVLPLATSWLGLASEADAAQLLLNLRPNPAQHASSTSPVMTSL